MSKINVNAIDKESGGTLTLGGAGTKVALHANASSDGFSDEGMKNDIAILGFKVAANGSLSKYNLSDQTIDDFQDATGIDASASTNDERNASNYYVGSASGTITQYTASGSHTATSTGTATILIVGGGGGGGKDLAGGGGAGGAREITESLTSGSSYTVTIGAGGAGSSSTSSRGSNGGSSVFNTTTVTGGGGGASRSSGNGASTTDGSGGGGAGVFTSSNSGGSAGAYGNAGGNSAGSNYPGGGGGGAGSAGSNATANSAPNGTGGAGGAGQLFSTFSSYGESGYFAGGGGGASSGYAGGSGGTGGGGDGGSSTPTNGTANTGGGGGGGGAGKNGGAGGSGVVIVQDADVPGNLTLVSIASSTDTAPNKADIVMTYTNGAGNATINTDLKAYASRDNGTTWTQATLSSEGTTGGHEILSAHNIDISSQPSGTSMRYKIETLNQSASKETRIQAVSLGWS